MVSLELSCESYPPAGEILEEALSEAEGPSTPQVRGISSTSPLRVDSTVPSRQRCDIIPVAGMGSETSSPLQSASSRDTVSTSGDHSQDSNVDGLVKNFALDKLPAGLGSLNTDQKSLTQEIALQHPRRQAATKQRQLLQRLLDDDAL